MVKAWVFGAHIYRFESYYPCFCIRAGRYSGSGIGRLGVGAVNLCEKYIRTRYALVADVKRLKSLNVLRARLHT